MATRAGHRCSTSDILSSSWCAPNLERPFLISTFSIHPCTSSRMKRHTPTMRRLSSSTRFPPCHLTADEEAQYGALSQKLLGRAIAECETTLSDMGTHWKCVRTVPVASSSLKVYKSTHPPQSLHSTGAAQVMATGIISGTMEDVMTCLCADNSFAFRMNSALLMPKEHVDCEVLHAILESSMSPTSTSSTTSDKYRFLGLKWAATKWPSLTKHRDMCYMESAGVTRTTDAQGHVVEYGYCLMESIDLPAICPPLDQFSIKRIKVSLRHVFRTLPIGCTLVMSHCSIDLGSQSSPSSIWLPPDLTTFPQLVSIAGAADVAASIRLSNALLLHTTSSDTSSTWNVPEFLRKAPRTCALCLAKMDRLEKHRVVHLVGASGIKIVSRFFCPSCKNAPVASPLDLMPSTPRTCPGVERSRPAPTAPLPPFSTQLKQKLAARGPEHAIPLDMNAVPSTPRVRPHISDVARSSVAGNVDMTFLDQLVRLSQLDVLSHHDQFSMWRSSDLSVDELEFSSRAAGENAKATFSAAQANNTCSSGSTVPTSIASKLHLPILDFDDEDDDDDDAESVYSALDISVRELVPVSPPPTSPPSSQTTCSRSQEQPAAAYHPVAHKLMQLNIQMQHTMNVLRQNQSRADLLQRDLEYAA
ncbi:hypothetical protein H310_13518 [Aphanomyces invadans]|uniref:Uncharacterized protein n=1 Tax=Aphanomyces invadans TaxID=157072 RepID=A0A024TEV0_9STRA|nr:hypothetical protein H310_13518 [Aphanomyces invadans]ETV92121.1 hypothetical protein H310_13518 [Aphanomyces invadans]|eukprot:XP_008879283.1 hypothetical protein H310_13518 [Aphanomyces invadans]